MPYPMNFVETEAKGADPTQPLPLKSRLSVTFLLRAGKIAARNAVFRCARISLGITSFAAPASLSSLISFQHRAVYHLNGSAKSVFATAAIIFCFMWAVAAFGVWLGYRFRRLFLPIWSIVFASVVVPKIFNSIDGKREALREAVHAVSVLHLSSFVLAARRHGFVLGLWLVAFALLLGYRAFRYLSRSAMTKTARFQAMACVARSSVLKTGNVIAGWVRGLCRFLSVFFDCWSLFGVVAIILFLVAWHGAWNLNFEPALHVQSAIIRPPRSGPRVIWILLDELSYDQVYGRRFQGLSLPAFDDLAASSTVFTHVTPTGVYTELAMPSLIGGYTVNDLDVSAKGQLLATYDTAQGARRPFVPTDSVFQDAIDRGYSTAVSGFYNPYCRIYRSVLDRCFWFNSPLFGGASITQSVVSSLKNLGDYPAALLRKTFPKADNQGVFAPQVLHHQVLYETLLKASDKFLTDNPADFLLLHMPIPHPPGIYNRREGKPPLYPTSYLDNLELADHYLAHVHQMIEAQGQWDSSLVIVMGDHSWRTRLIWREMSNWTAVDEAASHGGQFDDRPGYIVKLPYQHEGARIEQPFAALRTREMFAAIMSGRLKTKEELAVWAAKPAIGHLPP